MSLARSRAGLATSIGWCSVLQLCSRILLLANAPAACSLSAPAPPLPGPSLQLVDEKGNFREDNFAKMRQVGPALSPACNGASSRFVARRASGPGNPQVCGCGCSRVLGDATLCCPPFVRRLQTFGESAASGGAASEAAQPPGDRRGGTPGGRGGGRGGRGGDDRRKSGGRGGGRGEGGDGKKGGGSLSEDLQKLVKLIHDRKFEPAIVFSFSRRWGAACAGIWLAWHGTAWLSVAKLACRPCRWLLTARCMRRSRRPHASLGGKHLVRSIRALRALCAARFACRECELHAGRGA